MTKKLSKRGLPPMRPETEIVRLLWVSRQTLRDIREERQSQILFRQLAKLVGDRAGESQR